MPAEILVVCTANIARSPLAAALLDGHVQARGLGAEVVVSSAGVHATPGRHAAPASVRIAERWGFDLSAHQARSVTELDLSGVDLVLAMTAEHRDLVSARLAGLGARCFALLELSRLVRAAHLTDTADAAVVSGSATAANEPGGAAAGQGVGDRIARVVHAANRHRPHSVPAGDEDVTDPYGCGDAVYVEVANLLAAELAVVADALFGGFDDA